MRVANDCPKQRRLCARSREGARRSPHPPQPAGGRTHHAHPARLLRPNPSTSARAGEIRWIILIGPYARKNWQEDSDTISFSDYEFWIVVSHPLFKEAECHSRDIIHRESGNRCAVGLELYSRSDIRISKAESGTFILDRIEAGSNLYRASRDAPLPQREPGR